MYAQPESLWVRVTRKSHETRDICLFELADEQGGELPPFTAGAHIDVFIPGGTVRQYSLCNDPADSHRYVIAVLHATQSRGGSAAMHAQVREGDLLQISTPRNLFPLQPAACSLLFAGGIGITPMLAMAEQLSNTHGQFALHYCARAQERAAFLARLRTSRFGGKTFCHFDEGDASQQLDLPSVLTPHVETAHLYVCGPQGFMDRVIGAARSLGWASERIHHESFGAACGQQGEVNSAFEIELKRTGGVHVVPADRSVASVLLELGVELPLSCESGFCGTCVTRVLDGRLEHRDSFLTDAERDRHDCFTPCCSRAASARLMLDL
ncbi:PDR/VanB family oxidoreductase [Pseudomonas sp. NCHU5208]|uniref:PDR/VanB family oxidoreductase n=1 Tax=unclassified Pseudomonas TaxID=196821 RepID=UPI003F9E495C